MKRYSQERPVKINVKGLYVKFGNQITYGTTIKIKDDCHYLYNNKGDILKDNEQCTVIQIVWHGVDITLLQKISEINNITWQYGDYILIKHNGDKEMYFTLTEEEAQAAIFQDMPKVTQINGFGDGLERLHVEYEGNIYDIIYFVSGDEWHFYYLNGEKPDDIDFEHKLLCSL